MTIYSISTTIRETYIICVGTIRRDCIRRVYWISQNPFIKQTSNCRKYIFIWKELKSQTIGIEQTAEMVWWILVWIRIYLYVLSLRHISIRLPRTRNNVSCSYNIIILCNTLFSSASLFLWLLSAYNILQYPVSSKESSNY